jgi:hypothetical protein
VNIAYRARVLTHLEDHPGLTAYELGRALGTDSRILDLLRRMERKALVVSVTEWRPLVGRNAQLWSIAPAGPAPDAAAPAHSDHRRELDRIAQRRKRARARGLSIAPAGDVLFASASGVESLPPGAVCRGTDSGLFFPPDGSCDPGTEAAAICAGCPIRRECYALALANGEKYGIWGGVNFGVTAGATAGQEAQAS